MKKTVYAAVFLCIVSIGILLYRLYFEHETISVDMFRTLENQPAIVAYIEDKPYLLKIDLGSKFFLSLENSVFEKITHKTWDEPATWRDAKGNYYEAPSYRLPVVKIGNLIFENLRAKQESEECATNTTLWNDQEPSQVHDNEPVGCLGRPLLEQTNVLFDFQNWKLSACKNFRDLKDVCIDKMISMPFELDAKGIFLIAKTDIGDLRLILDTGSTISVINAPLAQDQKCPVDRRGFQIYTSQQFQLGGHDFGTKNSLLYNFSSELHNVDGAIGMDFLSNRVMYIDYPSRILYLSEKK